MLEKEGGAPPRFPRIHPL